MYPVGADLDALRALGELADRQARHIGAAQAYVQQVCAAEGAFYGVLGFFAGTYQSAVQNAVEGLTGNQRSNEFAGENFRACQSAYEQADRASYDSFSRIAGGSGWDVGVYRAAGSGASLGGPLEAAQPQASAEPAAPAADSTCAAPEEDGGSSWGQFAADTGKAVALDPSNYTREYVKVDGQYYRADTVGDGKADSNAFTRTMDDIEKGQEYVLDPGKPARDGLVDSAVHRVTGEPGAMVNDGQTSSRLQHGAQGAASLYGDAQTVVGTKEALTNAHHQMTAAVGDVARYHDIADDEVDRSAIEWGAGR